MKTIEIQLYKFDELSEEAKRKAIDNWKALEDFSGLKESLGLELKTILKEKGIKVIQDLKINYSLSYCQGDGVSFTGLFDWRGVQIKVYRHNHSYSHEMTCKVEIYEEEEETVKIVDIEMIESERMAICKRLEKFGYEEIDYMLSDAVTVESLEANDYDFTIDGKMY